MSNYDIERDRFHNFLFQKFNNLIIDEFSRKYTYFGYSLKMKHYSDNKSINIIELFQKYTKGFSLFISYEKNLLKELFLLYIEKPNLKNPLFYNRIFTNHEFYEFYMLKIIDTIYDISLQKSYTKGKCFLFVSDIFKIISKNKTITIQEKQL
jgi:hypothetical protein